MRTQIRILDASKSSNRIKLVFHETFYRHNLLWTFLLSGSFNIRTYLHHVLNASFTFRIAFHLFWFLILWRREQIQQTHPWNFSFVSQINTILTVTDISFVGKSTKWFVSSCQIVCFMLKITRKLNKLKLSRNTLCNKRLFRDPQRILFYDYN